MASLAEIHPSFSVYLGWPHVNACEPLSVFPVSIFNISENLLGKKQATWQPSLDSLIQLPESKFQAEPKWQLPGRNRSGITAKTPVLYDIFYIEALCQIIQFPCSADEFDG